MKNFRKIKNNSKN